ncbi:MAG: GreA/GreB family elongation factor [Candidatus Peribacteria bacterium]|nr:MAG: GreA/GreB family elongation factor [Candidatus Peribacteria bacterium]
MAEKEFIEARIEEIKNILHDVEIIENTKSGDVRYGSIVTFKDDKGRSYTYTVVGTGEVNVLENTISLQSPLGMALR